MVPEERCGRIYIKSVLEEDVSQDYFGWLVDGGPKGSSSGRYICMWEQGSLLGKGADG